MVLSFRAIQTPLGRVSFGDFYDCAGEVNLDALPPADDRAECRRRVQPFSARPFSIERFSPGPPLAQPPSVQPFQVASNGPQTHRKCRLQLRSKDGDAQLFEAPIAGRARPVDARSGACRGSGPERRERRELVGILARIGDGAREPRLRRAQITRVLLEPRELDAERSSAGKRCSSWARISRRRVCRSVASRRVPQRSQRSCRAPPRTGAMALATRARRQHRCAACPGRAARRTSACVRGKAALADSSKASSTHARRAPAHGRRRSRRATAACRPVAGTGAATRLPSADECRAATASESSRRTPARVALSAAARDSEQAEVHRLARGRRSPG